MAGKKPWTRTAPKRRPAPVDEAEKQAIVAACDAFIRDVLKPLFLPEVRPTEWNYVIDIYWKWAAGRYRFIQRGCIKTSPHTTHPGHSPPCRIPEKMQEHPEKCRFADIQRRG
jgi:hypothetical protein